MTKNDILRNAARSSGLDVYGLGLDRDKWEGALARYTSVIVEECAEIAVFKDSGTVATADVAGHMAAGRSIAARLIKEHFGVTE